MNKEKKEIEEEIKRIANIEEKKAEKRAQKQNDAPCTICGNENFIQKFRNVVGEISGSMHGNFSLLGGSVSGSIDGSTETLPVLVCRKCGNERKIATWKYVDEEELFWNFMHNFYFRVTSDTPNLYNKLDKFFLYRPIGTREFMLDNKNYNYKFYNEIPYWDTETWANAGFKIPKIKKKHFIFWEKEVYPTWEEFKKNN